MTKANEPEYFTIELGSGVPSYVAYLKCSAALSMLQQCEREQLLLKLADDHRYLLKLEEEKTR